MTGLTRITTGGADFGPCEVCGDPATVVTNRGRRDGQMERHPRCKQHPFLTGLELERKRIRDKYRDGRRKYT